jgi:type II secretory pathway component PulM
MDKDFDILARKVAEYIGTVQPQLDRISDLEAKVSMYQKKAEASVVAQADFVKRATEALTTLADSGIISKNDINHLVEKSAEDASTVWGLVEKMAMAMGPEAIGSKSHVTMATADVDPFMREFSNYNENTTYGIID